MMASESRRADLMTLLAIASGHAPQCPLRCTEDRGGHMEWSDPTPDEWAAHIMAYARALGRAVDAELATAPEARPVTREEHAPGCVVSLTMTACDFDCPIRRRRLGGGSPPDAGHDPECAPDSCAAGCPEVQRQRERDRRVMQRVCDAVLAVRDSGGNSLTASFELDMAAESYRALRST